MAAEARPDTVAANATAPMAGVPVQAVQTSANKQARIMATLRMAGAKAGRGAARHTER